MKPVFKVLIVVGSVFFMVGMFLTAIFTALFGIFSLWSLFPLFFAALGICFILPGIVSEKRNRDIVKYGKKIPAKISGYAEDKHVVINGSYAVNTKVSYFDNLRRVKECVLETGFQNGSNKYPIGMTLDIYEYNGKYGWDRDSVRQETLFDERELMDGIEAGSDDEVVIAGCKSCGASFCAVKGYACKCPYCGAERDSIEEKKSEE